MNPWCLDCEIFHPKDGCDLIRELRANARPRVPLDQSRLPIMPTTLCRSCGATVDDLDEFCPACEATIRVAEHRGDTEGLSSAQRLALDLEASS